MLKKLCRIGISLMIILNSCVFAVPPVSAEDATDCAFEIGTNYVSLKVGETFNPNLTNTTGKEVTWTSNAQDVAEVDNLGNITAKKAGVAKITAATNNNDNLKTCDVNVYSDALVLNSSYKRIAIGESFRLRGIIKSESPSVAELTLTPNDKQDVVSIDGDTVTAAKAGTTVVTATASGGETAICAIEVYDPRLYFENNFFEISGTGSDDTAKGLKGQAQLKLKGELANPKDVKYTCYASKWMKEWNGNVAGDNKYTFDKENMTVTAKNGASGMIEIIAKSGDATATATIMVGGCAYGTYETAYVTGTELLKGYDDNIENVVPANYANHYLWKYGYASYGQTDYTLMTKYVHQGTDNADRATVSGSGNPDADYWVRSSVHMPSDYKTSFRWNPGRNGDQTTWKDAILVFRAPKSGKIKVNVGVDDEQIEINKCNMPFKVIQKNQVVYEYKFDANISEQEKINPTGFKNNFATKTLDVQKGEEILFTLAYDAVGESYWLTSNINVNADKSLFNITYDSITEESAVDAHNITLVPGEEYDFSDITAGAAVSLKDDIVSVNDGKIKAEKVGKTEVFILDAQGKKTTLNVSVKSLSVKKSADGNSVTVKGGKCSNGIIYAAEYADGRLLNVITQATNADKITSFTMPISGNNTVKAFMWDENLKPKCYSENL